MPVEKEAFWDNMSRLNEFFPDKDLLSVSDVIKFTGRHRSVVERLFTFKKSYISKATLARQMS